jgi:hypothetical protein
MADYVSLTATARYSASSDYSDPTIEEAFSYASTTPTSSLNYRVTVLQASDTTVELGSFTTIYFVLVKNRGSYYVTATFASTDIASNKQRIAASGPPLILTDVLPASDLVLRANTADCICDVIVVGV